MPTLLVVDDDRAVRHLVRQAFQGPELEVVEAATAAEGLDLSRQRQPDTVLLDIMLPEMSGLEAYRAFQTIDPKLPVIFITALDSSDVAIQAMSLGAYDFVLKPLEVARLCKVVRQALDIRRLMNVPVSVPGGTVDGGADRLVGRSPAMQDVYKAIGRVAPQNVTVLIRGESGTGKELVARAIYQHSPRASRPFLAVNCAAIPDTLLESELFGHEKGAFTGADQRRIGKFEQCNGGTLFLDEVGDMSLLLQAKMLRVLQQQQFERVGGNQTITTDVRLITATNRDLEKMVEAREFRADLYYRLSGFTIHLPPLRERTADVPLLLDYFLRRFSTALSKDVQAISPEAMAILMAHHWPGNIRELENVVRQALLNTVGPVLLPEFLQGAVSAPDSGADVATARGDGLTSTIERLLDQGNENLYAEAVAALERYVLRRVLSRTQGNISQSAKMLGITRGSLRNKIRALGLSIDRDIHIEEGASSGDDEDEYP
ncbi:MAG: sigma-54-dependent Fis family transcriptional regulator [Planctomycetia bacterium]|nr:sigma-54-dependent Fis family transcriptional regulator [Planctomycetia bacterium]